MGLSPAGQRPAAAHIADRSAPDTDPQAAFRDAPWLGAGGIEASRGRDAQEQNGRRQVSNAVSLQVEPELVLGLRRALAITPGIKAAFVHGSIAEGEQSPATEIELMVIVDPTYAGCFGGLDYAENLLKRRIRANFVSEQKWRRELRRGNAFFGKINAQPRIVIFASVDDLLG